MKAVLLTIPANLRLRAIVRTHKLLMMSMILTNHATPDCDEQCTGWELSGTNSAMTGSFILNKMPLGILIEP